jgi:hypothetical protein
MTAIGYMLFGLGCILGLFGEVKFLVVAYRRSLWWFFGCLFIPLVALLFFLLNIKATWRPVLVSTVGFIIAGIGYRAGGFGFLP